MPGAIKKTKSKFKSFKKKFVTTIKSNIDLPSKKETKISLKVLSGKSRLSRLYK